MNRESLNQPGAAPCRALARTALALVLLPALAAALPDDREQELQVNSDHLEFFLDEGKVVHHGTDAEPVVITQGSMRLVGTRITIESAQDEVTRITATGAPARFQQQPALDEGIVRASGNTIVYDDANQRVIVEEGAEFMREGNRVSAYRIEYDMQGGRASFSGRDGERVNMTIQPQENSQPDR